MPSQISPPIEYSDGDPINADAFNNHVKLATLQNGSISEQVDISLSIQPSVNKLDSLVVLDESEVTTNRLRKIKVGELLTVDSPVVAESVTTSEINAKVNEQLDIAPNAGILLVGKQFYSADGFNVIVTSTGHLLETGMLLEFSNAAIGGPNGSFVSGHDGRYQITVLTSDTFTYRNGLTTATVAGSGTLNYRKAPTVYIAGSEIVNDDIRVAGNAFIAGNTNISGAVNVGSLKISGKTPLTKEDSYIGIETKTVILAVGIPSGQIDYSTFAFNVPPGETWTFNWIANTNQTSPTGNTRPDSAYTWQVHTASSGGVMVDDILARNNTYGGTSIVARTIIVRNEGSTGNTHTITSATGTYTFPGTMSLNWKAIAYRSKWDSPGQLQLTLFKQKTNTMAGQAGSGIPFTL